jgi:hypothetical protein
MIHSFQTLQLEIRQETYLVQYRIQKIIFVVFQILNIHLDYQFSRKKKVNLNKRTASSYVSSYLPFQVLL